MISTDPKDYPDPPPLIEQVRMLELRCERLEADNRNLRVNLTEIINDAEHMGNRLRNTGYNFESFCISLENARAALKRENG